MSFLHYRANGKTDQEERLEDACLQKALYDEFGAALHLIPSGAPIPSDGVFLGAIGMFERPGTNLIAPQGQAYWRDKGFLKHITRQFSVQDLDGAIEAVKALHAEGRDAFVKATELKLMAQSVPVGTSLTEAIGDDLIWSFIDKGPCLMVQEAVQMRYEHRFICLGGEIASHSPVAWHLTPMSRAWLMEDYGVLAENLHYPKPSSQTPVILPELTQRMREKVNAILADTEQRNLCIDVCLIGDDPVNGTIEPIEFNPMQPGQLGLYACDPRKLARGIWNAIEPDLAAQLRARMDGDLAGKPLSGPGKQNEHGLPADTEADQPFHDGP